MSKKHKRQAPPPEPSLWQRSKPTPKAGAGLVAGAITTILVAVAAQFDVEITAEVAAAITTIIVFIAAWFAPRSEV